MPAEYASISTSSICCGSTDTTPPPCHCGTANGCFGALLLGYYEEGRLRYAGRVGTGFGSATLRRLRGELDGLEQARPAFDDPPAGEHSAHWVRPELVAEVGFREWTRDGRLRHPRFLGLRDDKPPRDVVRERAGTSAGR